MYCLQIQKEATNQEPKPAWNIEVDIQHPSGGFPLDMIAPFINVYENITNIVVRISQTDDVKDDALLLSSHFDTSFGTPGASDDGRLAPFRLRTTL